MIESGGSLGFPLKPIQCTAILGYVFRQEFQGDESAQRSIHGLIDNAHSPAADFFDDPIATQRLADHGEASFTPTADAMKTGIEVELILPIWITQGNGDRTDKAAATCLATIPSDSGKPPIL